MKVEIGGWVEREGVVRLFFDNFPLHLYGFSVSG